MNNTSLSVNAGDFDEIKNSFKDYLRNQDKFRDYDFEGSNINVLLSVMAYNTYLNMFYHNMASNETFLDSALLRDSVVSRAKELNYTPRSFKSATATINVQITSDDLSRSSIVLPKGTLFTGRIGSRNFSFTTDRSIITTESTIDTNTGTITFYANNLDVYEGHYITESVPYIVGEPIVIPNQQVDVSSISVMSIEDNGGNILPYRRATTLFGLDETTPVYFVNGGQDSKYLIDFGDGLSGRRPKANSLVTVDYRISNGEIPNGVRIFTPGQPIDGEVRIAIQTVAPAHSGAVFESVESIKYNAPRHFTTQERAVIPADYENLLREEFPEIIDVSAVGGEDTIPPRYGNVVISVVLNGIDYVPARKQQEYYDYLRSRSMMKPAFVEPTFIYAEVNTTVKYDVSRSTINFDNVRMLVMAAIIDYSDSKLNKFGTTLRSSRLGSAIDNAHPSIDSNDTSIRLIGELRHKQWINSNIFVNFETPVQSVVSNKFSFKNTLGRIVDNGQGLLQVLNDSDSVVVPNAGSIDYQTGLVTIRGFVPDNPALAIKVYATIRNKDVTANKGTILKIRESDVTINVVKA